MAHISRHDVQHPTRRATAEYHQPGREFPEHQVKKSVEGQPVVLRLEHAAPQYLYHSNVTLLSSALPMPADQAFPARPPPLSTVRAASDARDRVSFPGAR